MRVVTLDKTKFDRACITLQDLARDFRPDLIVGIATGGVEVANRIFKDIPHCNIYCSRVSTKIKSRHKFIFKIIRQLPIKIRNVMRMTEAIILRKNSKSAEPVISEISRKLISESRHILLVDDAIDSGHTMQKVISAINEIEGDREMKTAVITVTTRNPLVTPDFYLYNNITLIRFPWAKDA